MDIDSLPVVIGSSLSGLLVSDALSDAGVEHVLIGGDEPPDIPRLGESLNEVAGPELWEKYHTQFRQCFFKKKHICLLNGEYATLIHVERSPRESMETSLLHLAHLDRIGFDRALYHACRARPECRFVTSRISRIDWHRETDRVNEIALDDGTRIDTPRYVFDATGFAGLVASAAEVGMDSISNEQRVVWTHFFHQDESCPEAWWGHGTNLLRLQEPADGLEGIAWLIPLGSTLSVGVSLDADRYGELASQRIVDLLCEAYERRGIGCRSVYPRQKPIQQLTHRCYVRERAFGANWALVGGTFISIWFPSSAGVWTSTSLAGMAADLIEQPRQLGAFYEKSMRNLLGFHQHLESMIHGEPFQSRREARLFWNRWIAYLPARLSTWLRIRNREFTSNAWRYRLLEWLTRHALGSSGYPPHTRVHTRMLLTNRHVPNVADQANAFPKYFRDLGPRQSDNFFRFVLGLKRKRPLPGRPATEG